MTTKAEILEGVDMWIDDKLSGLIGNNPLMKLVQPTVKRGIKNYIGKYEDYLNFITDKDGNIDFEGIFDETIEQFKTMDKMPLHTDMMGDIMVGKGSIDIEIPMVGKSVSIATSDIMQLKELILNR